MPWYYVENGRQTGPIDEAQFEEFARSGKILVDTLVWREGMAEWQSYGQARTSGATGALAVATAAATTVDEEKRALHDRICDTRVIYK